MQLTLADHRLLALLCVLILSVYLLVYTNAPREIDGADTLDVAATLLQHGKPAATRLTTVRQLIEANAEQEFYTLSPDGERYSKKGVTPSLLLLPFVALSEWVPGLSTRATAMLLNPLVALLTALQLYIFARRLNAPPFTSALLTLVFAFATLTIVYVKTLFGEPLAALLLLVAVYQSYTYVKDHRSWRAILAGAAIGLCIGVNLTYTLLTVPIGLYILWAHKDLRAAVYYALPIVAMFLFLGAWNAVRFGSPFATGYALADQVEGFTTPLGYGLTGFWLSFYKGVFWFQPVLLLGIFGLRPAWRTQRALVILCAAIIAIHATTYAAWWAWDGAWSWGGRFAVPLLPIMMLSLLPILKRARQDFRARVAVVGLVAVSAILQVPGILYSYIPFYESVYNGQLFSLQNHAALAAFTGLFSGPFDPAVLSEGGDIIHLVVVVSSLLAGLFAATKLRGHWRAIAVAGVLVIACYVTAARQQAKPSYQWVRDWEQTLTSGSTVYIQSFEFDTRLLDISTMRLIVTNPHAPQSNPRVAQQWNMARAQDDDFWLVTWFPPATRENWAERELWQQYPFVEQRTVGGHRALHFDMNLLAEPNCPTELVFDAAIKLAAYGTWRDSRGLYVSLKWQAQTNLITDYSWFVHLLDEQDNIVFQQDRAPNGGYSPTSSWLTGQSFADYLLFPLADTDNVSNWRLRIGFVNPSTGSPVAVSEVSGESLESAFAVLPLSCVPPPSD